MKFSQFICMLLAFCTLTLAAAVPELEQLVPDAKDFELIYKLNPKGKKILQLDNSETLKGKLTRIGYLLKLTDKQGQMSWAYAEMDPFTQELYKTGLPTSGTGVIQTQVTNFKVASNVPGVENGTFEKGNIEFWSLNFGPHNSKKIPGASSKDYDFGDMPAADGNYGCMQIHNYLKKQTVIGCSGFPKPSRDLGIGNNAQGNPDWTFAANSRSYQNTEFFIVGKFDSLEKIKPVVIDSDKIKMSAKLDRDDPNYQPGEPMKFTFSFDFGDQKMPEKPCVFHWQRTGDDGITQNGKVDVVPKQPFTVTVSSKQPGFVRLQGWLRDYQGRDLQLLYPHPWLKNQKYRRKAFDGGAGVQIDTLKQAVPEPEDFDTFWAKQKTKLDEIPVKATMKEVPFYNSGYKMYAVSVDCPGPRPVTGFLVVPVGAQPKSLPVRVSFQGYGTDIQRVASYVPGLLHFNVNAHGYDLLQDDAYYKDFFAKIKSNGQGYAFDPKQNSDPETAYFNGMALRVMRALQFAKTLPEWDGKNLIVSGVSQGGLQAIWAAALDSQVTEARPGIPWCADIGGPTIKRQNGWRPSYTPALNYYDAVNHAKRIPRSCNVTITKAGLGDYICPPSGVTVLYNNITAPKKIIYMQGSNHEFTLPNCQSFTMSAE